MFINKKPMIRLFISAVFSNLLLYLSLGRFELVKFLISMPLFLLSTFFIFLINITLLSLFKRENISLLVSIFISILLSLSNFLKIKFRKEPIVPDDFGFLKSIPSLLRLIEPVYLILFLFFIITFIFLLIYLVKKKEQTKLSVYIPFRIRTQALILSVSIMVFFSFGQFEREGSLVQTTFENLNFSEHEETLDIYRENGFIPGFISKVSSKNMIEPKKYSKKTVESIINKYQIIADNKNKEMNHEDYQDISVVYILSESLSDPSRVKGVTLDEKILPYIQNPEDKYMYGQMIVPTYGGNTANTEFEVLTGFSLQYMNSNTALPFNNFVADVPGFPSFVDKFKKNNLESKSIAIHSYTPRLFNREAVYENFGFDEVYFVDDMTYQEKLDDSDYVSDESTFKEIMKHLKKDESQFIHVSTMQNHSPYSNKYDDQYEEFEVEKGMLLEKNLKNYIYGIQKSDKAIEQLIKEIDTLDKKIILVYYGDHLPGIYSSLLEINDSPFDLYATDYFIYKNFETTSKLNANISSMSVSSLTNKAASVKLTWLDALRDELSSSIIPGQSKNYLVENKILTEKDLDDTNKQIIEDFKMIQYDFVEGKRHSLPYLNK